MLWWTILTASVQSRATVQQLCKEIPTTNLYVLIALAYTDKRLGDAL